MAVLCEFPALPISEVFSGKEIQHPSCRDRLECPFTLNFKTISKEAELRAPVPSDVKYNSPADWRTKQSAG
jgi:hypothetical protein